MRELVLSLVVVTMSGGCAGPFAPSCERQTGPVLSDTAGTALAGSRASYEVSSPVHSNLIITLIWNDPSAQLGLQATILACGGHAGCQSGQPVAAIGTQSTVRELRVDGWQGKQYRIDVLADPAKDQTFTIRVTYDTGICT